MMSGISLGFSSNIYQVKQVLAYEILYILGLASRVPNSLIFIRIYKVADFPGVF